MKTRIVSIGNSQGVRIPKLLLEEAGLEGEVDLTVDDGAIVIRKGATARQGWREAFAAMAEHGDDALLDAEAASTSAWDDEEWEWQ